MTDEKRSAAAPVQGTCDSGWLDGKKPHPRYPGCTNWTAVSAAAETAPPTRFLDFDDESHPFFKWWNEHGQFMMSGGGRIESIWAARGWIAREQLACGVEVTGDSMHEDRGAVSTGKDGGREDDGDGSRNNCHGELPSGSSSDAAIGSLEGLNGAAVTGAPESAEAMSVDQFYHEWYQSHAGDHDRLTARWWRRFAEAYHQHCVKVSK